MTKETTEPNDHSKSENENDDEKSDEFKNFERALKGILAIPPDEAKEIIRKTPYPNHSEEDDNS